MPPARRKVAARKNASKTRRRQPSSSPEEHVEPTPPSYPERQPSPEREPTPPPPPQPPRVLHEQALNTLTDEWEPRLFPRKKAWDFLLKHLKRKIITERGIGKDSATFAYIKRHRWETLAKEGADWEKDDQDNPLGFPANALQTLDLNLWHHFICCNLMSTSYTTKVAYEQALLLYVIVTDIPFDAASMIRDQFTRCIKDPKVKSWYFPVMITMLCRRAGMTFLSTDTESSLQQPLRLSKLDQRPPGASSSGQAAPTPTPAGQLRQRDFNKQTRFILDYVHQC
ncbi:OLC1v1005340C1 [Oldenlandia corymbosa var. corymbosa]|uniref:OLC1v1005340C1 n=1 Tax=Oldenlandia corymbosa var. corymbosa TaxID=529605 RepID=A0AAV1DGR9_OLDCO|nr:OLC1v1005340C1 [Oldenlandia corymbosa var. corymbosa]